MHLRRRLTIIGIAAVLGTAAFGLTIPRAIASTPAQTGCSGSFTLAPGHSTECMFASSTPTMAVGVGASVGRSTGAVIVRLQRRGPAGTPDVLIECAAASARFGGGCAAVTASSGPIMPPGTLLTCVVTDVTAGRASGLYGCDSSS